MSTRPDITLTIAPQEGTLTREGTDGFVFRVHSAAANAFLARKFAQVEGDLDLADASRIVAQARLMGFTVLVER